MAKAGKKAPRSGGTAPKQRAEHLSKATIDQQVETIMFGAEFGDDLLRDNMRQELRQRIADAREEGRPLRVYAGYDPSTPDLHLGHTITMRKLRQFQDFGHEVTFLVGTFTAQVGDTSDKDTGRPRKSEEETAAAARTYAEQCYKILDREKTLVRYNGEWLSKLTLADTVSLASNFTVQQFLARDRYRQRIEAGNPIGLHEFFYALLQGYDAVQLRCDVQIGATEQLFNILAGRKLQEIYGQKGCVCITYPILVGTDGTMRMSKSTGNTIGITEAPDQQYGKTMSISDATMREFIKYVTRWTVEEIKEHDSRLARGDVHPMELKKKLAWEIVSMYHGDAAADEAQARFETMHQRQEIPADLEEISLDAPCPIVELLHRFRIAPSKSEARRLVDGGGVRLDGDTIGRYDHVVTGGVLQVGKRRIYRVVVRG